MAFATKALSLILVIVVCSNTNMFSNAAGIRGRCECLSTSSRPYHWKKIEEFSITPAHSRCKNVEIILTLNTGKDEKRCISPDLNQAKKLQECWERLNKEGKATLKASECLQRK